MKVQLRIYSGRPDPKWTLSADDAASLRLLMQDIPEGDDFSLPAWPVGGYGGMIVMGDGDPLPEIEIAIYREHVRVEHGSRVRFLIDEARAIENMLLDTATGHVQGDIVARIRSNFQRSPLGG